MKVIEGRLHDAAGDIVRQHPTPNLGGTLAARFAVIHYTAGGSLGSALRTLSRRKRRGNVSAHLVIGRDGAVAQLADFRRITWHAGVSKLTHKGVEYRGLNRHAIGIELVNYGWLDMSADDGWRRGPILVAHGDAIEARHKNGGPAMGWQIYPKAQIDALIAALRALHAGYGILDVVGHDDIAPQRKTDPGPAFPLSRVRRATFGPSARWTGRLSRLFSRPG